MSDVASIGSSGTLIGAALQTVGVFYQSDVLDYMASPFAGSVPALIYLVAVIAAAIYFAHNNNFRGGLWLLIGPGLFSAVVFTRVEVDAVDWKFGYEFRNPAAVADIAGIDSSGPPARVATLYSWFDRLVSSVVRGIEAGLAGDDRTEADKRFLTWAGLYGITAEARATDAGFRNLLHGAFAGKCGNVMRLSRTMFDPTQDYADRCTAALQFREILGTCTGGAGDTPCTEIAPEHMVTLSPIAQDYVANLYSASPSLQGDNQVLVSDSSCTQQAMMNRCEELFSEFITSRATATGRHPTEIPQGTETTAQAGDAEVNFLYSIQRVCRNASTLDSNRQTYMNELCQHHGSTAAAIRASDGTVAGAARAVAPNPAAMAGARELASQPKSCSEIWGLVYAGLIRESMSVYDNANRAQYELGNAENDTSLCQDNFQPEGVVGEFEDLFEVGSGDPNQVVRAISKKLLANELGSPSLSSMIERWADTSESIGVIGFEGESEIESYERARVEGREWQEQTRLMYTAGSLPYYQGLGLYFLSVLFPFWALMLIIPGRHATFLLWFQYYAWLKSWDVGFAIVMVMDEFLSTLFMGHFDGESNVLSEDMTMAFNSLQGLDPSFHISQYYSIIATSLMSVPIMMSYIMLGGVTRGAQLVSEGIGKVAGQRGPVPASRGFGGASADTQRSMRATQASGTDAQALRSGFQKMAVRAGMGQGRLFTDAASASAIHTAMASTFQAFESTISVEGGYEYVLNDNAGIYEPIARVQREYETLYRSDREGDLSPEDRIEAGEKYYATVEDMYVTGLLLKAGSEFLEGVKGSLRSNSDAENSQFIADRLAANPSIGPISGGAAVIESWIKRNTTTPLHTTIGNLAQVAKNSPEAAQILVDGAMNQYSQSLELLAGVADSESLTNPMVLGAIQYSAAWGVMPLPIQQDRPYMEQVRMLINTRRDHLKAISRLAN